jgi:Rab-GTPase-TBC domain
MPTRKPQMSIEECLFGPEKKCPTNVWDAVLTDHSGDVNSNREESFTESPAPLYLGIDDLDEGRWARPENQNHSIPIQEVRRLSSQGLAADHRGVVWRVLLGGLPLETEQWKPFLLKRRMEYRQLVADLFVEPQHDGNELRGGYPVRKKQQQKHAQAKRIYELQKGTTKHLELNAVKVKKDLFSDANLIEEGIESTICLESNSLPDEDNSKSRSPRRSSILIAVDAISDPTVKVSAPRARKNLMEGNPEQNSLNQNHTDDLEDQNSQQEADDVYGGEELSGFEFTSQKHRPSMTRTAASWIRRNTPEILDEIQDSDNNSTLEIKETKSNESIAEMVPSHIREEWKKSGRDIATLDHMQNGSDAMNTLLVSAETSQQKQEQGEKEQKGLLVSVTDDPLSTNTDSIWFQFFENASLLDEIRKDVVRTHPELYFFLEPENNLGQRRYAALERILFVWAKLNTGVSLLAQYLNDSIAIYLTFFLPQVRYVQGMNEIVGTIYYVLANDESEVWACEAEADSYYLFNTLMAEMRDVFVAELDEADTGIQGRISNMTALLSLHDPEVRCHLVDIGIDPAFYAVRWLTTLLSREFLLPDTIRLWDSMFASTHKDNFIRYVCVTMVVVIRDKLLKGDFSTCLRLLQSYPTTNIDSLLESSRALWIYESQVTLACHKGGISLHQALCTITPPPSIIMAYGLPGGVARLPREEEPAPRGFFSRANAVLGQLGSGVRGNVNRGRTQSDDGLASTRRR